MTRTDCLRSLLNEQAELREFIPRDMDVVLPNRTVLAAYVELIPVAGRLHQSEDSKVNLL